MIGIGIGKSGAGGIVVKNGSPVLSRINFNLATCGRVSKNLLSDIVDLCKKKLTTCADLPCFL